MDVFNQTVVEANGFKFNTYVKHDIDNEGYIICQHGVGSSAATFALFLESIFSLNPKLGAITYDIRHHGKTESTNPGGRPQEITDLDLITLCEDLYAVIAVLLSGRADSPPLILVGHSMGGSVVSKFANFPNNLNLRGLVVIDAVEGYATESLASMRSLLSLWPESFDTLDDAINWHLYQGKQLRNKASARISVPPLLVKRDDGKYTWKLDLKRTSSNWDSWFQELDKMFINAPCARLLILSGVRKLDTDLTRAQMQGKFQMVVVNESGHYIQEDTPMRAASAVNDFYERSLISRKFVPKFGQFRLE